MTWRGITLDRSGITLDAEIGWAATLPVLALILLGLAVWYAYARSVGGKGWLARTTAWINAYLSRREIEADTAKLGPGLVFLCIVVGAIWLVLLLISLIGMVWVPVTLALGDPLSDENAGTLRWYLLTFTALTAALGALVALPFTLVRTRLNARQTETAQQSHITDQINKAVEALGAEKTVSRMARTLAVTTRKDGFENRQVGIEWHDTYTNHPIWERGNSPEAVGDVEVGDWTPFTETVPNREVRIGAIYALERIAQDSLRDHVQIMEILTAYIRENAPADAVEPLEPEIDDLPKDAAAEERAARAKSRVARAESVREAAAKLKADTIVQAAIQVIGRRTDRQKTKEASATGYGAAGYRLDLRETNLRAVDLTGADLKGARLIAAHLEGAVLVEAHLEGAVLFEAHLEGARLIAAHLEGADLSRADLEGAFLGGAHLEGADLVEAHLEGADLSRADLEGAYLGGAHLEGAVLFEAHLEEANLVEAHLEGADLSRADLEGAFLVEAHLEGADLDGAHLEGAFLGGAHLEGAFLGGAHLDASTSFSPATLRGAGLKEVDFTILTMDRAGKDRFSQLLTEAFGDGSVALPEGVVRPGWPEDDLDYDDFLDQWRAFQRSIGYEPPSF